MSIDQMEQLNLDVDRYATAMADMLAIMHWSAQIDASDMEFVLVPPRLTSADSTLKSIHLGEHDIWILDFNCCHDMTMDTAGIDQAWPAFYKKRSLLSSTK